MILVAVVAGCGTPTPPPPPPQVLASGVHAFGIAVDSTNVYVCSLDRGPMLAIPIDGGAAVPLGFECAGKGVAVDEQRLYWSGSDGLMACDKSNCAGSVVQLANTRGVWDIVLDANNIYWTTLLANPSQILMTDKHGGTPVVDGGLPLDGGASGDGGTPAPFVIGTARYPYNLAVDGTYAYWIDQMQPNSGVVKAPIAGGPAVQISVSDPIEPGGLALDDQNVYYGNGSGQIFKVSKDGGPTHLLLGNVGWFPGDLLVDGTTLYIGANTKLLSVPLAGGIPGALADLNGSGFIALDETSIYVADDGDGNVLKVAR